MPDSSVYDYTHATPYFTCGSIVILGDLVLDVYLSGKVERISPEAPVPVLLQTREEFRAGGAANVALNIAALGGTAKLLGFVGQDGNADKLQRIIERGDVKASLIRTEIFPTTTKTRVLDVSYHQLLRIDREVRQAPTKMLENALLEVLETALEGANALVMSDYAKGCLSDAVIQGAIALCKGRGLPVLVDPKRRDFEAYAGADFITPNLSELAAATQMPCGTDDEILTAAQHLVAVTGSNLLVTMSERGMALFPSDGGHKITIPTFAREVFDVSGAGDTVIAVFAALLAGGETVQRAMHAANVAAGVVIGKAGTAIIDAEELARALAPMAGERARPLGFKIASTWELLERQCDVWRAEGLTVGFTNGCFDLLHPGHVTLLNKARMLCDKLVVGLNTDASVKRLKGPTRPVQAELARVAVMSALADVDAVVLFDEDTPLELIMKIKPDVLIKGADYAEDQIVGASFVRAQGGSVARIPLVTGQSTTKLIHRSAEPEGDQ